MALKIFVLLMMAAMPQFCAAYFANSSSKWSECPNGKMLPSIHSRVLVNDDDPSKSQGLTAKCEVIPDEHMANWSGLIDGLLDFGSAIPGIGGLFDFLGALKTIFDAGHSVTNSDYGKQWKICIDEWIQTAIKEHNMNLMLEKFNTIIQTVTTLYDDVDPSAEALDWITVDRVLMGQIYATANNVKELVFGSAADCKNTCSPEQSTIVFADVMSTEVTAMYAVINKLEDDNNTGDKQAAADSFITRLDQWRQYIDDMHGLIDDYTKNRKVTIEYDFECRDIVGGCLGDRRSYCLVSDTYRPNAPHIDCTIDCSHFLSGGCGEDDVECRYRCDCPECCDVPGKEIKLEIENGKTNIQKRVDNMSKLYNDAKKNFQALI